MSEQRSVDLSFWSKLCFEYSAATGLPRLRVFLPEYQVEWLETGEVVSRREVGLSYPGMIVWGRPAS